MKIARYETGGETVWGAEDGSSYRRLRSSPFEALDLTDITDDAANIRLLAPVPAPRIFGVGLNYVSHIEEGGQETPQQPMLFMKPSTTVIGPDDAIIYPPEARNLHFEAELTAVIGRKARRISVAEALDAVLGYTCANDISERVIQAAEMALGTLLMGKGYDTFCPLGPVIATDLDPTDLEMQARVNGERRQSINTSDLLFSVAKLVSYLSQGITLLPGDVIITGTPAGVRPVRPGDVVEIEIEGIGVLRNNVVAE